MSAYLIAGGAAFLAYKLGLLSKLTGGLLAPSIYQLTEQDAESIAANYSDGHSTFQVFDYNHNVHVTLHDALVEAILTHQLVGESMNSPYCQGFVSPGSAGAAAQGTAIAAQAGVGIAQSIGNSALKAIPIIGEIASVFEDVFNFIGAHHAAAVKRENSLLCPLIGALNNSWAYIDQKMKSGSWNGQQVLQAAAQVKAQAQVVFAEDSSSGALDIVRQQADAITDSYSLIVQKSGI